MKVCLISTPTVTEFKERRVVESEAHRLIADHAPLGILSLAAVLEQQDIEPDIVDLNRLYYEYLAFEELRPDGSGFVNYVVERLEAAACEVFGFSTICSSYPLTLRLARRLRQVRPGATIVLGGPQASVVDVETLKTFPFVDYIVRGEAEETFPRLLESFSHGGAVSPICGITYRGEHGVVRTPNAPVIENLDSLPMPAFHLYSYTADCSYAPLEAGRGCPFECSFCSTNDFFRRRFRMKSPDVIVDQMKSMKRRYGITSFELVHDMFTVDRKKVVSFCDAVKRSGEQFYWTCSARTDCVDEELISRMRSAGCDGIFYGIDTGSERMQKVIHKRLDLAEAAENIRQTNLHGINFTLSLITGFPDETKEDLRETTRFAGEALRFPHIELQLHLLAPLAETPITTRYKEQLVHDEILSDQSFQGWEQDVEDKLMINGHRDIFPNFYAIPTLWLERRYLQEFREFLLHSARRHQELMALLHRDCGDLLRVFDEWRSWSPESQGETPPNARRRSYYMSQGFSSDFLRFVRTHYLKTMARHSHLVATLADVEAARLAVFEPHISGSRTSARKARNESDSFGVEALPMIASDARLIHVQSDYKRLMRCLKRRGRLDHILPEPTSIVLLGAKNRIRILQLSGTAYHLLRLCDGSRNIMEIASSFSATEQVEGVPAQKAALHGLLWFTQRGLIDLKPAAQLHA